MTNEPLHSRGMAAGASAYLAWGLFPLYFAYLSPLGPFEVVAHRIVWSLIFMLLVVTAVRGWRRHLRIWCSKATLCYLLASALLLAINWLLFVYAVHTGHTIDASLGYFINPIVTVVLAVLALGERMRGAQWVAMGFSVAAVAVIWFGYGSLPLIPLLLALTFGTYGLVKNRVGRSVTAIDSLTAESALLAPASLAYLAWLHTYGQGVFGTHGVVFNVAIVAGGVVTGLPLLLFGAATRRIPLRYIGMLQYITPIMQFLLGVLVFHEAMPTARWVGFSLVWVAVVILLVDGLIHSRSHGRLEARGSKVKPA